jgi:hypothetical protein
VLLPSLWPSPTLALSLQPRAKWVVVVQHVVSSSRSVAATVAHTHDQFCRVFLTPSPRASIALCVHTHSHTIPYAHVAGRPYHIIRRHTLTTKFTLGNNHHCGLSLPIVRCLFLGTIRHLHLSLIGSHCCCRQSRPDLHLDATAHS